MNKLNRCPEVGSVVCTLILATQVILCITTFIICTKTVSELTYNTESISETSTIETNELLQLSTAVVVDTHALDHEALNRKIVITLLALCFSIITVLWYTMDTDKHAALRRRLIAEIASNNKEESSNVQSAVKENSTTKFVNMQSELSDVRDNLHLFYPAQITHELATEHHAHKLKRTRQLKALGINLFKNGKSVPEVMSTLHIAKGTAYRWLKEAKHSL